MGDGADDATRTAPGPVPEAAGAPARRPGPYAARRRRFRLFWDPKRRVFLRTR